MAETREHTALVAVRMPAGPAWREAVESLWASGAALLPIDHRLPDLEVRALLERARHEMLFDGERVAELAEGVPVEPDVRVVIPTSGTGGVPRLVELTHKAIDHAVSSSTLALEAGPGDHWVCCLPLAHVGGLLVLLRAVLTDSPVSVHPRFDTELVAGESDAAFISVVPTMLKRLLDANIDLSRFRAVLVGGASLDPALAERARDAGAPIVRTYGLTESCGGVVHEGRPLAGTEVRLGANLEVQLSGPTVMKGYRLDPDATDSVFTDDGWLLTGDAGELAPDGSLQVDGRLDDLIVTGGEKVWPDEVEAVLRLHPRVADVAVAGRPDADWGERVVAFVVPRELKRPPSLDALRRFAAKRLPRYKAPREVVLLAELPRVSALGKVHRQRLPVT